MEKLVTFLSIAAVASAALHPSRNYLPQYQKPAPSLQAPSQSYLSQKQGGFQQNFQQHQINQQTQSSQIFQALQTRDFTDTGNRRPQQEIEKNAQILKLDQEVNADNFHYSYETSNGIKAEQSGDTTQSRGGFSYQGDDGNIYSVIFTAGDEGFVPQGAHLPVAPAIPQEILDALEKNAKDEAAGIFDDGLYHPEADNPHGKSSGSTFAPSSSSTSNSLGSSLKQTFASSNRQSSFNSNSGYQY